MTRDRILHVFSFVVPLLLFLVLLCGQMARYKTPGSGVPLTEEAQTSLVTAETIMESSIYGLQSDTTAPIIHNGIWIFMLAGLGSIGLSAETAAILCGTLLALFTILLILRMAHRLEIHWCLVPLAGLFLVMAPGLISEALSATASSLATMMVTAAVALYVYQQSKLSSSRLPALSALFIAAAAWVRLEFIVIWIALALHASLMQLWVPPDQRGTRPNAWGGFFRGLVIILVALTYQLVWNTKLLGTPMPRLPGSLVALDQWGSNAVATLKMTTQASLHALPQLLAEINNLPFLSSGVARLLTWVGMLAIGIETIKKTQLRAYTVIPFLLLVVPVFLALCMPYTGVEGGSLVLFSFGPLCALVAAFGWLQIARRGSMLVLQKLPVILPSWTTYALFFGVSLFMGLVMGTKSYRDMEDDLALHQSYQAGEQAVFDYLQGEGDSVAVFTDRPASLTALGIPARDITGSFYPDLLRGILPNGNLSPVMVEQVIPEEGVTWVILWEPEHAPLLEAFTGKLEALQVNEPRAKVPAMLRVSSPDVL